MDGRRARALLGVDIDADSDEIRRAFRARALATHPDRGGDRISFELVVLAFGTLQHHDVARRTEAALASDPSDANLARLVDIQNQLANGEGTEALIEGFGASSRIHTSRILSLSEDLPILVVVVARREKIEAFLPTVEAMVGDGLITTEKVRVVKYQG